MRPNYEKNKIAIRYWLIGKCFYRAVKAMNFAEQLHSGLRKDGQHEFSHQVTQALYCRTICDQLISPEDTFVVIFLHDIVEDKGVTIQTIEEMFGKTVAGYVWKISKVREGVRVPDEIYYKEMGMCHVVSVCKGLDRDHNISTMLKGMKLEKQKEYIKESKEKTVVMLKMARKLFPEQESIYENIKYSLFKQIQLYEAIHEK
jgi:(p)ppGpp synthase/HD superfamily hydrolase